MSIFPPTASARPSRLALLLLPALLGACAATPGGPRQTPSEAGLTLLRDGRVDQALPLLSRAHAADPEDLDVARALTEAHVRAGRTGDFLAELAQRPPGAVVHYMRALALYTRASDAAGPAVESFRAAVAAAPARAELHHRLGVALLESEQVDAAVEPLKTAVSLEPATTRFRLPLAKALALGGQRDAAVEQLAALVRATPPPAPQEIRTARTLMGLVADPYAELPSAVRPRIDQALAALQERDQPQAAILTFEEVLRDFPDLSVVHALLGLAWLRLDDAGRALDQLRQAAALAPWNGENHLYLGNLYASRQRADQAEASWRKAVELHPLLDEAWSRLGTSSFDRGALDEAIEAFRIAVALRQEDPGTHGRLASAYLLAGRHLEAEASLQTALDLAPQSAEILLSLGLVLTERAETLKAGAERTAIQARARDAFQKVLELQPDNLVASRALEKLAAR